ncbi:MAG TPA: hypothetical protein VFP21_11720 [Solirubrobacterales bacterium]|nr:hypothetical protein [Solirubrobacterales bacterium]
MSRPLRLLGAALLAVVATGAVGATGAQAGTFTAGAYPATITSENIIPVQFTTQLGAMICEPTLHGELGAASETLTVTPNYGATCRIGGKGVHVKNNGCDFLLHAGATKEGSEVEGSMDIVCPEGKKLDFEITSMPVCHLTVPGQGEIGTTRYTSTVQKDIVAHFELAFVFYELDNGCSIVGSFLDGSYEATTTLKADSEGFSTPLKVD